VPAECPHRILLPVNDGRMLALDADSGKLCEGFGDHGTLNLEDGMGEKTPGFYEPTSPPIVSDQILVVAGAVTDNYSVREPSGVIRGFDIHTGRLVWAWDAGNLDENEMPSATHVYTNNSPNSWITASYDPKLGLVYMPMGVQTPDIWGGNRSATAERYSSALVALDIKTGKRAWSYQTVHHDLWDMDLPSQPTLVDLKRPEGDGARHPDTHQDRQPVRAEPRDRGADRAGAGTAGSARCLARRPCFGDAALLRPHLSSEGAAYGRGHVGGHDL
jgi:quinoprotein glucose dehydrogenase